MDAIQSADSAMDSGFSSAACDANSNYESTSSGFSIGLVPRSWLQSNQATLGLLDCDLKLRMLAAELVTGDRPITLS
jgi:hypothetical protein